MWAAVCSPLGRVRVFGSAAPTASGAVSPPSGLVMVSQLSASVSDRTRLSVAVLAEQEPHHPDLHLTGYKNVAIELSTHAIGGLSANDFIVAAKIDKL